MHGVFLWWGVGFLLLSCYTNQTQLATKRKKDQLNIIVNDVLQDIGFNIFDMFLIVMQIYNRNIYIYICYILLSIIKQTLSRCAMKKWQVSFIFFFFTSIKYLGNYFKIFRKFFASDNNNVKLIHSTDGTCKKLTEISNPYCQRLFVYIFVVIHRVMIREALCPGVVLRLFNLVLISIQNLSEFISNSQRPLPSKKKNVQKIKNVTRNSSSLHGVVSIRTHRSDDLTR